MKNKTLFFALIAFLTAFSSTLFPMRQNNDGYFGLSTQDFENVCIACQLVDREDTENHFELNEIKVFEKCALCEEMVCDTEIKVTLNPCKHLMHDDCFFNYVTSSQDCYGSLFGDSYKRCPKEKCGQEYMVIFKPQQERLLSADHKLALQSSKVVFFDKDYVDYRSSITSAFLVTMLLTVCNETTEMILQSPLQKFLRTGPKIILSALPGASNVIETYFGLSTQNFITEDGTHSTLGNFLNLTSRRVLPFYLINRKLVNGLLYDLRGCINWKELSWKLIELIKEQYAYYAHNNEI